MPKVLTIVPGVDFVGNAAIASIADFNQWFTQATFGGVDRDHFATGTNPVVSSSTAPSTPATGLGWHDTAAGLVSFWNGSEWLAAVTYALTAPSNTGLLWYDTTLKMLRRYKTMDGLAGWHPEGAHQLVKYSGGTGISVGEVVYHFGLRLVGNDFDVTAFSSVVGTLPMPNLAGVALEAATLSSDTLVICPPVAGLTCEVTVATTPTVAYPDLLQSRFGTTAGVGADPLFNLHADGQGFAGMSPSYPAGVFARATGSRDATSGRAPAVMLGGVGQGRYVPLDSETTLVSPLGQVMNDAPQDVDFSSSVTLQDADHVPWKIRVKVDYERKSTGAGDVVLTWHRTSSANATGNPDSTISMTTPSGAAGIMTHTVIMDVPTNAGSGDSGQSGPSGHDTFVTYEMTAGVTPTEFGLINFIMIGYWI